MLGERRRWRRGRDSNPRYGYPYAAFRVRCFQPLSHLSILLMHLANLSAVRLRSRPLLPNLLPNAPMFGDAAWQADRQPRVLSLRQPASSR